MAPPDSRERSIISDCVRPEAAAENTGLCGEEAENTGRSRGDSVGPYRDRPLAGPGVSDLAENRRYGVDDTTTAQEVGNSYR